MIIKIVALLFSVVKRYAVFLHLFYIYSVGVHNLQAITDKYRFFSGTVGIRDLLIYGNVCAKGQELRHEVFVSSEDLLGTPDMTFALYSERKKERRHTSA